MNEEFQKITYKRKGKNKGHVQDSCKYIFGDKSEDIVTDQAINIRKITEAKEHLQSSNFYSSFVSRLKECLPESTQIDKLVCFGLGFVSEQMCSQQQLALTLCLKNTFKIGSLNMSDPQFCKNDKIILEHFNAKVISENLEAKYSVQDSFVLFFLPHCTKELSNNLLWSNWCKHSLSKCVIISNSFSQVLENSNDFFSIKFIKEVLPHCVEVNIVNSFKHFEVFCDTSIHYFPLEKLDLIPESLWAQNSEPEYCDDSEYIALIKTKI